MSPKKENRRKKEETLSNQDENEKVEIDKTATPLTADEETKNDLEKPDLEPLSTTKVKNKIDDEKQELDDDLKKKGLESIPSASSSGSTAPPPPAPLRRGRNVSLPGAFAVTPSGGGEARGFGAFWRRRILNRQGSDHSNLAPSHADPEVLVNATLVPNEPEHPTAPVTPQLAPLPPVVEASPIYHDDNHQPDPAPTPPLLKDRRVQVGLLLAGLIIVGLTVGLAMALADGSPLTEPSADSASDALLAILAPAIPSQSVDDIRSGETPQGDAFAWMMEDAVSVTGDTFTFRFSNDRLIQRYVLATLYFASGGDDWYQAGGWLSGQHECLWFYSIDGVCNEQEQIKRLSLENNGLSGEIPRDLGALSHLEGLNLISNSLHGTLPEELGWISPLRALIVAENRGLIGRIPPRFGELEDLELLELYGTHLEGTMPETVCALTEDDGMLEPPRVHCARVDCDCCDCFDFDTREDYLRAVLALSPNSATETFDDIDDGGTPQENAFLFMLEDELLLSYPEERIVQRFALATLFFATDGENWRDNHGWLSSQHECDWYNTDEVQVCFSDGIYRALLLDGNNLRGTIPREIALLDELYGIAFGDNQLEGLVPTEIGNMVSLEHLLLGRNPDLTGRVPRSLSALVNLVDFHIHETDLFGNMPRPVCDLESVHNLRPPLVDCILVDCDCCACGQPSSPSDRLYTVLSKSASPLSLRDAAQDDDTSPQALAKQWLVEDPNFSNYTDERLVQRFAMASLFFATGGMDWDNNDGWLSENDECTWYSSPRAGRRPRGATSNCDDEGFLVRLDLRDNGLVGSIYEIALLENLVTIDLEGNDLQGNLPARIGLRVNGLEKLIVSDNPALSGRVPRSFGELQSLVELDLDGTSLSGTMPESVCESVDLGRLEPPSIDCSLLSCDCCSCTNDARGSED